MNNDQEYTAFDIVGDIHGHARSLERLLETLGYSKRGGFYHHESRKLIFIGDFIDRGEYQRETIAIARAMVEAGSGLAVMGNHEFNAIAYFTPDSHSGDYLRPHSDKNTRQHEAFLDAYKNDPAAYEEVIDWFKTLPMWLDFENLRVVHACWDHRLIRRIVDEQDGDNHLSEALLHAASRPETWQYTAVETLLKGKEIPLQPGVSFTDKDGTVRHRIRVRWWDQGATSYRDAFMGPESARCHLPDDDIEGDHLVEYSHDAPPVFLGHYWLEGEPAPLTPNIACLDYSVAKPGGKLVAYRWDGEPVLDPQKFVWVERCEG